MLLPVKRELCRNILIFKCFGVISLGKKKYSKICRKHIFLKTNFSKHVNIFLKTNFSEHVHHFKPFFGPGGGTKNIPIERFEKRVKSTNRFRYNCLKTAAARTFKIMGCLKNRLAPEITTVLWFCASCCSNNYNLAVQPHRNMAQVKIGTWGVGA